MMIRPDLSIPFSSDRQKSAATVTILVPTAEGQPSCAERAYRLAMQVISLPRRDVVDELHPARINKRLAEEREIPPEERKSIPPFLA